MSKHGQTHNEQTLRPAIEEVVNHVQWLLPGPDHKLNESGKEQLRFMLDELLTTDRDAAYTMLREAIKIKKRDLGAIEQECHLNGVAVGKRKRAISVAFGNNKALDDILLSLDTIYGKTHTN